MQIRWVGSHPTVCYENAMCDANNFAGVSMAKIRRVLLLLFIGAVYGAFSIQGFALIPNYDAHPFHKVNVDFKRGDGVVGWKIFEDTENVDALTRLGFAFALAKFPTAQSCLETPTQPLSDTSALNWRAIKRPKQAAVCFFNIARAFGDRQKYISWLSTQLQRAEPLPINYRKVEITLGKSDKIYLAGVMPELRQKHCFLNLYLCVFRLRQSVIINMDSSGKVLLLHLIKPKISFN